MRLPDLLGATPAADIMEALFQDSVEGVGLLDAAGTVLRANARLRELTGLAAGRRIGASLGGMGLPGPVEAGLVAALRAGHAARLPALLPAPVAAGDPQSPRLLHLVLLPVPRRGALLRVRDPAGDAALEAHLAQARRHQMVGELAGGIAHDFNNLLTAILGAAADLEGALVPGHPTAAGDLAQIGQSARRGAELVRHLLAFSRQQTLQPRIVALNVAIRAAAPLLCRLLGKAVTLDLVLDEPDRAVLIDPTQLDQILLNLAVNAGHAMPQGGRLRIETGRRLVLRAENFGAETLAPGRYVSLSIADTGIGMSPALLARVFEPFFTTRREGGGTGLGLATVHGIVRQSGGHMAVRSVEGQGTVFELLFPKAEAAEAAEEAPPALAAPAPLCRTVLLVDDEAPVRLLAERVLRKAGWAVIAAPSADAALAQLGADQELGWVISDVVMPGMDGPALVQALRATRPGLRAILMSGYADAVLRATLAGMDILFIAKPFAMAALVQMMDGVG